jgi:hypothetical protein
VVLDPPRLLVALSVDVVVGALGGEQPGVRGVDSGQLSAKGEEGKKNQKSIR